MGSLPRMVIYSIKQRHCNYKEPLAEISIRVGKCQISVVVSWNIRGFRFIMKSEFISFLEVRFLLYIQECL